MCRRMARLYNVAGYQGAVHADDDVRRVPAPGGLAYDFEQIVR